MYAADIRAGALIEPGHMLWRPLGHLIGVVLNRQPDVLEHSLGSCSFYVSGASVLAIVRPVYQIASRMYGSSVSFLAAMLMMVSNGFWSYSFSGCAYTLSVLFTTIALGFAISAGGATIAPFGALSAGIFGGLAGATWAVRTACCTGTLARPNVDARPRQDLADVATKKYRPTRGWLCACIRDSPAPRLCSPSWLCPWP